MLRFIFIAIILMASLPKDAFCFKGYSHQKITNSAVENAEYAFQSGAPVPIANLFDTDNLYRQQSGSNRRQCGRLAEYSNANFLSKDTNPVSITVSIPPYLSSTTPKVIDIPHPLIPDRTIKRWYYIKNRAEETNSGNGYKLTAMSTMDFYWYNIHGTTENLSIPILDAYVYEEKIHFLHLLNPFGAASRRYPYEAVSIGNTSAKIRDNENARTSMVKEGDVLEDG